MDLARHGPEQLKEGQQMEWIQRLRIPAILAPGLFMVLAGCRCYYKGTRQNYEQLRHNQREEKADRRTDWYNAQHDDPLWQNPPDWDD